MDDARAKGIARYNNGRVYDGELQYGEREGEGKMIYPNGDKYEGAQRSGQWSWRVHIC
jgi:hypothetical protein